MNAPSRQIGLEIGLIHFIGIGGAGMSGIAELMRNMGYRVQGSDIAKNASCARLEALGVPIYEGHAAENLDGAALAVISSAIGEENLERQGAKARGIPVITRADMLAELMRLKKSIAVAGTHGKTTTTSLIAAILDGAGYSPTVINGGLINAYGSHARLGEGDWLVAEADESDGSFLRLPAEIAVVTNMDPEHMDHYGDFDQMRGAFLRFVESVPIYGFAVLCHDHDQTARLAKRIEDRRVITYGFSSGADLRGASPSPREGGMDFSLSHGGGAETSLYLPMPGAHNALNALAAIAVALELGVSLTDIREALRAFTGVKRRFSKVGTWNGAAIYDDYAHHPAEIEAVLQAASSMTEGRVIALLQPHRYSRLRDLLGDFAQSLKYADIALVSPVYAAGEKPIDGINRDTLVTTMRELGHGDALAIEDLDEAVALLAARARADDIILCMGAGSITSWAKELPKRLAERGGA